MWKNAFNLFYDKIIKILKLSLLMIVEWIIAWN